MELLVELVDVVVVVVVGQKIFVGFRRHVFFHAFPVGVSLCISKSLIEVLN